MHLFERAHVFHRAWRYRLRSERGELAFLMQQPLRGATVVDVGANRGIYSWWMHKVVGPAGRVIAFEPQPELFNYLRDLKQSFRLDRLTIENAGLSSTVGSAVLSRPKDHWGGASLEKRSHANGEQFTIALSTLDTYFEKHESCRPVKFIKCDIEGHELACFEGGRRLLEADHPTLLFESHGKKIEAIAELLCGIGYQGSFFQGRRLRSLSERRESSGGPAAPYLNYVFEYR